jgi:hypothetical protein
MIKWLDQKFDEEEVAIFFIAKKFKRWISQSFTDFTDFTDFTFCRVWSGMKGFHSDGQKIIFLNIFAKI